MVRKIVYSIIVIFLIWLAFGTRTHSQWFYGFVVKYGGDAIWAGMFLIFLRIFFTKIRLWKLALFNFALGVADEVSQLYHAHWIDSIRDTPIGGAILGHWFVWSDIICYAVGTFLAFLFLSIAAL
jgi:hypothetical protein